MSDDIYAQRWRMLALLVAGYLGLTLNWFNITAAFTPISDGLGASFTQLAFLIALFLIGYGVVHIPAGLLATRLGLKRTLVLGLALEGVGGMLSGIAVGYPDLAVYRVIAGIGGSIFLSVSVGAVSVWFRNHEINFALGVTGGAAFSVGAALGLYGCVALGDALGWRMMLGVCGAFTLAVAAACALWFRTPPDVGGLAGAEITRAGLAKALGDRQLWIYGGAMVGVYGAYITASQLLGEYAIDEHGFSESQGGLLGAVFALAGVPGSLLGGYVADRLKNYRMIMVIPFLAMSAALFLVPVRSVPLLWFLAALIGFLFLFSFPAWLCVPVDVSRIDAEHIGTAIGLMLTLAAVGGFLLPVIFGKVVPAAGYGAGWAALGALSLLTALIGLFGRPGPVAEDTGEAAPATEAA
ncbi:MFS transporter [Streptomyces sp. NA04227]|uniref:MFS transporter n=1 Tax=Streptomyces sp. NA04227 TaxID=2742136 RepID=UPI001590B950|nr:MFS transporter [Streptomyces sp. NA04227]QKW09677.1 MFS transporter [Streptomyces sp. NA04227]